MFSEVKYEGDHVSVAEELLAGIPELEQKGKAINKSVREGYFNLEEALDFYKVSQYQYFVYLLLDSMNDLEVKPKETQIFSIVSNIVTTYHAGSFTFDSNGIQIMQKLETITGDSKLAANLTK